MFKATTILAIRGEDKSVIGGDGQVSFGSTVMKSNATKIRTLYEDKILTGFAGSTADAFTLFDMFEKIIDVKKGHLERSVIEFSKEWRKDKFLRRLEAFMIVLNRSNIYLLSGIGDVIEPEDGRIVAIGSGGNYALSAARALAQNTKMESSDIVRKSLEIAADICIYTNKNIKLLELI